MHVFDRACNLIDERRDVLSVVTPQIGNGPFNLVIENDVLFSEHLDAQSPISNRANQLNLGDLTINTDNARLWSPRPDWELLHAQRGDILNQLTTLPITDYRPLIPHSLTSNLSSALVAVDITSAQTITTQLAGLGAGLTPAGDDFILGAMLAVRIIHPPEIASALAKEITNIAAPLTTSLSAAWLRSAGKGETGILWHQFFDALVTAAPARIREAMDKLLAVGETSGADMMAGFTSTLKCWAGSASSKIT